MKKTREISGAVSATQKAVIPAKAGIQSITDFICSNNWTPAFAGVTKPFSRYC
ncbi:MAG TPA: hypothetical protein VLG93_04085 [Sulfuricaulis sp.]|nr:hypothetical protein [Sulfuricaulis sp.]